MHHPTDRMAHTTTFLLPVMEHDATSRSVFGEMTLMWNTASHMIDSLRQTLGCLK